ncbi:MAG: hypothetical protein N838_22325 [Thiohalocapsa sp. PB-PSB1]|nr:MAG: hypothetical protein N838_31485 [Thiohalocapsa sp. PB-PSB1]QQO55675.1 MAG: hypothetical protein N838_22325 [Thiohalocapsa sp. PB-PSB1]
MSLLEHGFWMTLPQEHLVGLAEDETQPRRLSYQAPMTCFTELRLSTARMHQQRYGLLGVVVDRDFVLARWGAPVHYVRSNRDDPLVANAVMLMAWLQKQKESKIENADTIMTNMNFLVGFMKGMSDTEHEDFRYLDEQEWRIVHSHAQEQRERLLPTNKDMPKYLIPFVREDVQMLVVPDADFRSKVYECEIFTDWVGNSPIPVLTTEEIEHF